MRAHKLCGCIVTCAGDTEHEPRVAYCPLHASAPDLLAALEAISHGPTTAGSNPGTALDLARDVIGRSQEIARAAIRKAEGHA